MMDLLNCRFLSFAVELDSLVLYIGIIFKIQIFKTIILAHCHMYVVIKAA